MRNPDNPSNTFLKILDMGSIFIKNMKIMFESLKLCILRKFETLKLRNVATFLFLFKGIPTAVNIPIDNPARFVLSAACSLDLVLQQPFCYLNMFPKLNLNG